MQRPGARVSPGPATTYHQTGLRQVSTDQDGIMRMAAAGHEQPTAFAGESGVALVPSAEGQRDGAASVVLNAALCKPEEVPLRHSAGRHSSPFGAASAAPTNKRTHAVEEANPNDLAGSLLTAGEAPRSAAPEQSSWVSLPRTKKDRLLLRPAKHPIQQSLAAQQQESEPRVRLPSAFGVQATMLATPTEAVGACTSPSSTAAPPGTLLDGAPHGTTGSGLQSGSQLQAQVQVGEQLLGAIIAGLRQIDDPGAVSVAAAAMASAAAAGSSPSASDMAAAGATLHLQLQALVDHQQDHKSEQPPQERQRTANQAPPAKRWRQQRQAEGPAAGAPEQEADTHPARERCPQSSMSEPMDVSVSPSRLQAMSVSGAAARGPSLAPSGSLPSRPGASSRASGHGVADTCPHAGTDSVRQGPGRGCVSAAGSAGISGTTTGVTGPGRQGDVQQHTSRPPAALASRASLGAPGVGSLGRSRPEEHGGLPTATADTARCGAAEAAERDKRLQATDLDREEAERVRHIREQHAGTAGGMETAPKATDKQQHDQQQGPQGQQRSPGDAAPPQVPVKKSKVRIIQPISRTWAEEVQTKAGVLPGPSLELAVLAAVAAPAAAPPGAPPAAAAARAGSGSLGGGSSGAGGGAAAGAGQPLERQGSLQSGARTVSPRALGLAAPSHAPAGQAPAFDVVVGHAPLHVAARAAASAGRDSAPASLLGLRRPAASQRQPADTDVWHAARSSPPGPSAPLSALGTSAALPSSKPLGTSVCAAAAAMALQAAAGKRASPEVVREGHAPAEAGGKRPRFSPLSLGQLHPATSAPPQTLPRSNVAEAHLQQELLLRMLPGLLLAGGVSEAGLAVGGAAAGSVPLASGTAALNGPLPRTLSLTPPNTSAAELAGAARLGAVAHELGDALPRAALGTGVAAAALIQQLLVAAQRDCPPNAPEPGSAVQLPHADSEGSPFSTGAAPSVAAAAGALPLPYVPQPPPLHNASSRAQGPDAGRRRTNGDGRAAVAPGPTARRVSASGPLPSSLLCPGPAPAVHPTQGSKPLSDVLSLLLLGAGSSAAPADSASPLVSQVMHSSSEHKQQHWQQQIDVLRHQLLQQPEPRPSSLHAPARRAASARQLRGAAGPAALHPLPANTAPGGGSTAQAAHATALVVPPPGDPHLLPLRRQMSAPLPDTLRDLQAAPPHTLGAVQGELTLLYQWYVANKSVYMDLARHHLERMEMLTAVAAASAEATTAAAVSSAAAGSGSPAALAAAVSATEAVARVRSESAEAMRAFDTALHIMRACTRVEQQLSVPHPGPGVPALGAAAAAAPQVAAVPKAIRGSVAPGDAGLAMPAGLRGALGDVAGRGTQALLGLDLAGPGGSGFRAGGDGSLQGHPDSGAGGPVGALGPPGGLAGGYGTGAPAGGPQMALAVAAALVQAAAQQSPAAAAVAGAGAFESQAAHGGAHDGGAHVSNVVPRAGSPPAGPGAAGLVRGASPGAL